MAALKYKPGKKEGVLPSTKPALEKTPIGQFELQGRVDTHPKAVVIKQGSMKMLVYMDLK